MEKEIWKDIPNFKGYQVSNFGRVRTYKKTTYNKNHVKRHWKNRILKYKGKTVKTGYRVDLWKDGKPNSYLVARLVAFTFYEKDINNHNLTVNHIDGNRLNNQLDNLELISLKENIEHGFNNGLYHSAKKIKIKNKRTLEETEYRSMSVASQNIGKYNAYISNKIKKNIYENEDFSWELF